MTTTAVYTHDVVVNDQTEPFGMPVYEGSPTEAFMSLEMGVYPASPLDADDATGSLILVVLDGQSFAVTSATPIDFYDVSN